MSTTGQHSTGAPQNGGSHHSITDEQSPHYQPSLIPSWRGSITDVIASQTVVRHKRPRYAGQYSTPAQRVVAPPTPSPNNCRITHVTGYMLSDDALALTPAQLEALKSFMRQS
jgi:hypothetical protein